MSAIFLSASIPLPDRDPQYWGTADVVAIRDSIRALVSVVIPSGQLVFGGHQAITPLVRLLVRGMALNVREHVILFQSRYFEADFPPEVAEFEEVRIVDAVANNPEASLARMRDAMIRSFDFTAAVFIGGMEGVETEYELFREIHPSKPTFPIASTGAAASVLFHKHGADQRELMDDLRYLSLFRRLLRPQISD